MIISITIIIYCSFTCSPYLCLLIYIGIVRIGNIINITYNTLVYQLYVFSFININIGLQSDGWTGCFIDIVAFGIEEIGWIWINILSCGSGIANYVILSNIEMSIERYFFWFIT